MRGWRRRVVRIRGIHAWIVVPRAADAELVLVPVLAYAIIISSSGLASGVVQRRLRSGATRWQQFTGSLEGYRGWPPWGDDHGRFVRQLTRLRFGVNIARARQENRYGRCGLCLWRVKGARSCCRHDRRLGRPGRGKELPSLA